MWLLVLPLSLQIHSSPCSVTQGWPLWATLNVCWLSLGLVNGRHLQEITEEDIIEDHPLHVQRATLLAVAIFFTQMPLLQPCGPLLQLSLGSIYHSLPLPLQAGTGNGSQRWPLTLSIPFKIVPSLNSSQIFLDMLSHLFPTFPGHYNIFYFIVIEKIQKEKNV